MSIWRLVAVAVVLLGVSIGCGDEKAPGADGDGGAGGIAGAGGGGAGGDGGTGGGGGTGGDGGTGGTGGSEPRCGDGNVDPGEFCDDGNEIDGDGCSSKCEREGSCERPIDWAKVSTPDPAFPDFFASRIYDFVGHDVPGAGRCGGGGDKVVFRWVAPATGRMVFVSEAGGSDVRSARAYVRRTCDDPASEVWRSCQSPGGLTDSDVEEGDVLFLVFDYPGDATDLSFQLGTEIFPHIAEGRTCGPDSGLTRQHMWQCAPGFTCHDIATPKACTANEPPELVSAHAYRGGDSGNDVFVVFEANDPNADYWFVETRMYDEDGAPVITSPNPGSFDVDRNELKSPIDRTNPLLTTGFRSFVTVPGGMMERFPEIHRFDVRLRDQGNLLSDSLSLGILPQPVVAEGEDCDPARAADRCDGDDLVCRGSGGAAPTCESLVPDRMAACAAAEQIGVGELSISWQAPGERAPSSWLLPYDCVGFAGLRHERGEVPVRLHLEEKRTNVVIRTMDHRGITVGGTLTFHEGCGLEGPPLACENTGVGLAPGRLAFAELEAGDYLVVFSPPAGRSSLDLKLVVEADPLPEP